MGISIKATKMRPEYYSNPDSLYHIADPTHHSAGFDPRRRSLAIAQERARVRTFVGNFDAQFHKFDGCNTHARGDDIALFAIRLAVCRRIDEKPRNGSKYRKYMLIADCRIIFDRFGIKSIDIRRFVALDMPDLHANPHLRAIGDVGNIPPKLALYRNGEYLPQSTNRRNFFAPRSDRSGFVRYIADDGRQNAMAAANAREFHRPDPPSTL